MQDQHLTEFVMYITKKKRSSVFVPSPRFLK